MKILYLGYWPSADGLTQSVIVPRLEILSREDKVEEIFFCSVERENAGPLQLNMSKVTQLFFHSKRKSNVFFTKCADFRGLFLLTNEIVRQQKVSLVICNSPLAGMVGYNLHKKNNVPFIVECFEPHALYMLETGAWKIWDPRYWVLTYSEWKQKKHAFKLATVSRSYSEKLVKDGVPANKVVTVPNCIPLEDFKFKMASRTAKRAELDIGENDCVGIYVGKFGDIYYDDEAFDLFAEAFNYFGKNFRLIILTSALSGAVIEKLKRRNISDEHFRIAHVPREKVPDFLSASDFAFSTIRPSPSRVYCCPIKNGEYWANGLPILLEDGIGEDSAIIREEGGGVLLERHHPDQAFEQLTDLMKKNRPANANKIYSIAIKHRRMELLSDYYKELFDQPGF